ncbi:MAG: hypothetical protein K6G22_06120 [Lachnospiraceae bacterium]|nr:hypothetical protein [Lachnospiraceae bacterium]
MSWRCPVCDTYNDESFDSCMACGRDKPEAPVRESYKAPEPVKVKPAKKKTESDTYADAYSKKKEEERKKKAESERRLKEEEDRKRKEAERRTREEEERKRKEAERREKDKLEEDARRKAFDRLRELERKKARARGRIFRIVIIAALIITLWPQVRKYKEKADEARNTVISPEAEELYKELTGEDPEYAEPSEDNIIHTDETEETEEPSEDTAVTEDAETEEEEEKTERSKGRKGAFYDVVDAYRSMKGNGQTFTDDPSSQNETDEDQYEGKDKNSDFYKYLDKYREY